MPPSSTSRPFVNRLAPQLWAQGTQAPGYNNKTASSAEREKGCERDAFTYVKIQCQTWLAPDAAILKRRE